jgi:hypothetical protein
MQLGHNRWHRRSRRGAALLIALALLALGAALLAGSSASAHSAARAEASREASLLAEAESRAAIAEFMAAWNGVQDAIAVGGGAASSIGPRHRGFGATLVLTQLRLQRLSSSRFVLAADCQVGPDDAVLARRRVYLLLERGLQIDSTTPILPPAPIGRWGLADTY